MNQEYDEDTALSMVETSDDGSDGTPDDGSDATPDDESGATLDDESGAILDDESGATTDDVSGETSDDTSGETSDDGSGETSDYVSGETHGKQAIKLKRYGSKEKNFYDENGFLYSISNNSAAAKNYYLRCKNNRKYNCNAKAISFKKDLNNTILKGEHTHIGRQADVDKMKFCHKLGKAIRSDPLEFGREIYLKTMGKMTEDIDVDNIPDSRDLSSFIYRKKIKFVLKLPKTVTEFEEAIKDEKYKEKFTTDKKKQPFYRGIWKSEKGGRNIA